jgi:flavin-dependent dehydrogenase
MPSFNKIKVAIIGGGISGLYLAWKLSEKGNEVIVFEKKTKIGNDVCSGLFSKRILDFIPLSEKLIKNRINKVILNFPKKRILVNFSKEFLVISHYELDCLLSKLAIKSGVKIITDYNVKEIPEGFDRIIGCDGANSFIRNYLKLKNPNYRLGILGFINNPLNDDYVETWPCKNGFIWKIPRGSDVEYGIITNVGEANKIFDKFLEKNDIIIEKKAKLIPHGLITSSDKKITLCGDAAGITKLWSGGGVIWGFFAADILLKTFPDFKKYKKLLKRFFIPKMIISKIVVNLVYFLGFNLPWFLPKENKIESDFLF